MKEINTFTAGQYVYNNVAVIKATNKFTQEEREFYIPFKNSEIGDFFENINNFTLYFNDRDFYINSLTIRSNGKNNEIY